MPLPSLGPYSNSSNTNNHYHHHHHRHNTETNSKQATQQTASSLSSSSSGPVVASSTVTNMPPTTSSNPKHGQQIYSNNFWETYEHLCALQNQTPLQYVKSSITTNDSGCNLILNADKLKLLEWDPFFGALKASRNFKTIKIHSKHLLPNENDQSDNARVSRGYVKAKKMPAIRVKDRANKLCRAIRDCLSISSCLSQIEIFNIPLSSKDCVQIAKALRKNETLKTLSLDSCLIGDDGLSVICKDIQNSCNLNRINFSSCLLTHEGANILATLIKVQALKRHNEAWKDSLRYGRPDLDSMFGIRRITINSNPLVGDRGVQALADAFKSDLWLKALDLQDCGITTQGANFLVDGLKFNAMMHVLDVRLNPNIDRDTLQKIMEQVMINSSGNSSEYEWMELVQVQQNPQTLPVAKVYSRPHTGKKLKKRRNTNASFSIKPRVHSATSSMRIKRSKSTGSVTLNKSASAGGVNNGMIPHGPRVVKQHTSGIQWRAAARYDRFRGASMKTRNSPIDADFEEAAEMDEDDQFIEDLMQNFDGNYDNGEAVEPRQQHNRISAAAAAGPPLLKGNYGGDDDFSLNEHGINNQDEGNNQEGMMMVSTFDYGRFGAGAGKKDEKTVSVRQQPSQVRHKLSSSESLKKDEFVSSLDKIKNSSVKDLLVILQNEIDSKTQLEEMLIQFKDENTSLKSQVDNLNSKVEEQQKLINRLSSKNSNINNESHLNRTLLDDEKALEIIELTLYKYQNFLDFLRNSGFGKLIEMGEMNQQNEQNLILLQQQQHQLQQNSYHQQKSQKNHQLFMKKTRSDYSTTEVDMSKSNLSNNNTWYFTTPKTTLDKQNKNNDVTTSHVEDELASLSFKSRSLLQGETSIDSTAMNDSCYSIDTLLSNALEISRSYRRFNSSSVNNSTLNSWGNVDNSQRMPKRGQKSQSPKDLTIGDESNKENTSGIDQSTLLNNDDITNQTAEIS